VVSDFSALSPSFEAWAARREFASFVSILEPNSVDRILDVGAGYGWVSANVAGLCGELLALEPDRKRVRHIRRKHPSVKVILAVAEFLPFRPLIFDKIYLKRSFHHFTDQEAGLKEAGRVMKPEGILIIQEVSPERQGKLIKLAERWLRRAHVNFLSLDDLEVNLEREDFHVKYSKPAPVGFFLVANKKTNQTSASRF
jgi:ubiquinone/menaquinone biosynthesis C-methylase UbiE